MWSFICVLVSFCGAFVFWYFVSGRSRHTSGRSILEPLGDVSKKFVVVGNGLASRMTLAVLLASAKRAKWLLEQPAGS